MGSLALTLYAGIYCDGGQCTQSTTDCIRYEIRPIVDRTKGWRISHTITETCVSMHRSSIPSLR